MVASDRPVAKSELLMNQIQSTSTATNTAVENERKGRWNPYLVGAAIGILSWIAFAVVNQPLGISTSLSAASSVCALPVMGGEGIAKNAYWAKTPFKLDGGMLFLISTFFGSLISVVAGRSFHVEKVPATWAERFGNSAGKRMFAAFGRTRARSAAGDGLAAVGGDDMNATAVAPQLTPRVVVRQLGAAADGNG